MSIVNKYSAYKGLVFGLELELESSEAYRQEEIWDDEGEEIIDTVGDYPPPGWDLVPEDSIEGVEVIVIRPETFDKTVGKIRELFEDINRHGWSLYRTPRGSTHVHVNVSDLTWEQMESFTLACAWAEPFLIDIAGSGRLGNLFARSYAQAPMGWEYIKTAIATKGQHSLDRDSHYSAISFDPIMSKGSVEFRMGPSMTNADKTIEWLDHIATVALYGRENTVDYAPPPFVKDLMDLVNPLRRQGLLKQAKLQVAEIISDIARLRRQGAGGLSSAPPMPSLAETPVPVTAAQLAYQEMWMSSPTWTTAQIGEMFDNLENPPTL